jgi:hypothetical protein
VSQKFIVITDDEQVLLEDYNGYEGKRALTGGIFEHFFSQDVNLNGKNDVQIDFWCNEEFLYLDEYQKLNALASIISGDVIYGPAVLDVLDDPYEGTNRGFTEKEAAHLKTILEVTAKINQGMLKKMHEQYDYNKPDPRFEVTDWKLKPEKDDFER